MNELDKADLNPFKITHRCDMEDYFCTDSQTIRSTCTSVLDFIKTHHNALQQIESAGNTIIEIKRII